MRVQVSLSGKRLVRSAIERRPLADNDDEPFDPPPARALRAPVLVGATTVVADAAAVNRMVQAA